MQIAICDDEQEIRKRLAELAGMVCPDAEIIEYTSGEELLSDGNQPDILLLDIQMDGRDGMETARELRKENKRTIIIFVTAIEEYVFQAFDVGAFHYLVKPFSEEQFNRVLCSAIEQYREQKSALPCQEERSILIKAKGVCTRVKASDIVYAEVFNRKLTIHTMQGNLEFYGKMADMEKQAGEDFYRTHRAYLVHFKYVVKYDASMVYLEKGTALMSKGKFPDFVRRYLKYNQKYMF